MHRPILVQRRALAMGSIVESAQTIIEQDGLDSSLVLRLKATNVQDSAVADLFRLEALADLLKTIAAKSNVEGTRTAGMDEVKEFVAENISEEQSSKVIHKKAVQKKKK